MNRRRTVSTYSSSQLPSYSLRQTSILPSSFQYRHPLRPINNSSHDNHPHSHVRREPPPSPSHTTTGTPHLSNHTTFPQRNRILTNTLQFTKSAPREKIQEISQAFFTLKNTCLHPSTQKPYILSLTGGANTSTEEVRAPYSHGFLVTFASKVDIAYYLDKDPAHQAFKYMLGPLMEKNGGTVISVIGVVDWEE